MRTLFQILKGRLLDKRGDKMAVGCIVSAGPIDDYHKLKDYLSNRKIHKVICADGGMGHLKKLGVRPDVLLGDFDSCSQEDLKMWQQKGVKVDQFPSKKDATDTELALEYALEQGFQEILILGATGRRFDHTLANVHILKKAVALGVRCSLIDSHNIVILIDKKEEIIKDEHKYISLVPLTTCVEGVTTEGLKYPLTDATLTIGNSLGISNELEGTKGAVSITEGLLILIRSRD